MLRSKLAPLDIDSTNLDNSVIKSNLRRLFIDILFAEQEYKLLAEKPSGYAVIKDAPFKYIEALLNYTFFPNKSDARFLIKYKYSFSDENNKHFEILTFTAKYDGDKVFHYRMKPNIHTHNVALISYEVSVYMLQSCYMLAKFAEEAMAQAIKDFNSLGYEFVDGEVVDIVDAMIGIRNSYFSKVMSSNDAKMMFDTHLAALEEIISIKIAEILDHGYMRNVLVSVDFDYFTFDYHTVYEDDEIPPLEYNNIKLTKYVDGTTEKSQYAVKIGNYTHLLDYRSGMHLLSLALQDKISGYLFNISKFVQHMFAERAMN